MQKAWQVLNWNCSQSIVVCAFATLRMVRFAVRFATLPGLKETGFYICGRGSSTYAHAKLFFFNNLICLLCLDMLSDRNIGIKVSLVIKSWWCSNLIQSCEYTNLGTTQKKMSIYVTNISFLYRKDISVKSWVAFCHVTVSKTFEQKIASWGYIAQWYE